MKAYITERYSENVDALVALLETDDSPQLHLPEIALSEMTNILWKQIRFKSMTMERAQQILQNLRMLPLQIHPVEPYLPDALTIGVEQELAVYDSLYIALADAMGYPLITADGGQERKAMQVGVAIKPLTDFAPAG